MAEIVTTYVEMTNRSELQPGTPVPGMALNTVNRDLPLVPDLLARIGAPYQWRSARRSPQKWEAWFAEHPDLTCWLLTVA
ncbi:GNAT family N-acetyltransferase, partial [Kitasatospora sp. NPDC098663]